MAKVSFMRKQAPTFSVPSLADTSAEYRRLVDKRNKLDAQRQNLEAERAKLMDDISREVVPQARRERDARVAALLDDESAMAVSRPHARVSGIGQEIADTKAALAVLDDQIGQARFRASEKILDAVRPIYAERIEAICHALLELRKASAAYIGFTDELREKDIAWIPLNPMPVGFCGDPADRYSKYGLYLREAAKSNYFPYDKIPTELR